MEAPKHLTKEARQWWEKITNEYDITDQAGRLLLQTAMEAHDRLKQAQAAIKRDGATVKDRFDQDKPHPLLTTERDARSQMMAALKALNLDLEPLQNGPGRPPGR